MTEPSLTPRSLVKPSHLHVVEDVPSGTDLLSEIFAGQRHLMEKYHEIEESNGAPVIFEDQEGQLDDRQVQARIHQLFGYLVRELSEAMQELKLKPWKRTETPTDREAFVGEIGDCLHFFVELCITAGISAEELHSAYFRMHEKNQKRQQSDY